MQRVIGSYPVLINYTRQSVFRFQLCFVCFKMSDTKENTDDKNPTKSEGSGEQSKTKEIPDTSTEANKSPGLEKTTEKKDTSESTPCSKGRNTEDFQESSSYQVPIQKSQEEHGVILTGIPGSGEVDQEEYVSDEQESNVNRKKRQDSESSDSEPAEKRQRVEDLESDSRPVSPAVFHDDIYSEPPPSPIPVFELKRTTVPLQIRSPIVLKGRGVNASLGRFSKIIPIFFNDFVQDIIWLLKYGDKDSPIVNSCLGQGFLPLKGSFRRCHISVYQGNVPSPQDFVSFTESSKRFLGWASWQPLAFYNPGNNIWSEIAAIIVVIANCGHINTVQQGKESWELGLKKLNMVPIHMSYLFPVDKSVIVEDKSEDICKRTKLLMTITEMANSRIPLPIEPKSYFSHPTLPLYTRACGTSLLIGVDVENTAEPIRFTAVKETEDETEEKVLYDCLIQDSAKTRTRENFIERFPNIQNNPKTKKLLDNIKDSLEEARQEFFDLLPMNSILICHQLLNEFKSIQLSHPYAIDSSLIFTFRNRTIPGLKDLTLQNLGRDIQRDPLKHDPAEDAEASLNLVQLKIQNSYQFRNDRYIRTIKDVHPPLHPAEGRVSIISSPTQTSKWQSEVERHMLEAGVTQPDSHDNITYVTTNTNAETITNIEVQCLSNQLTVSVHDINKPEKLDAVQDIIDISGQTFNALQKNTLCILLFLNQETVSLSQMTIKR